MVKCRGAEVFELSGVDDGDICGIGVDCVCIDLVTNLAG